jgi:hypothetical protein
MFAHACNQFIRKQLLNHDYALRSRAISYIVDPLGQSRDIDGNLRSRKHFYEALTHGVIYFDVFCGGWIRNRHQDITLCGIGIYAESTLPKIHRYGPYVL